MTKPPGLPCVTVFIVMKLATLLALSSVLAAGASAQTTTKIEKPFRAEIGLYIPTFSEGDPDLGVNVGVGYSFYRIKDIQLAAVARGAFFSASPAGFDFDFALSTLGVDARYQPLGQKYFAGVGLNAYRADVHSSDFGSDDTTKLGYSLEAGYDFTEKLYGVVRYQAAVDDLPAFRGVTVGVGYRF